MMQDTKKWFKWIASALILGAAGIFLWQRYGVKRDEALASGNGRIESTEIDVAAKIRPESGRLSCTKAISARPDRWWC